MSRFWVRVVKSLRYVPMPVRNTMASVVAWAMWLGMPDRRHVTRTNLRLCFPELPETEVRRRARHIYRHLMRAALDHGVLWAGSAEDISKMVRFDGLENLLNLTNAGKPVIVIAPHFAGLDAAGIALNLHVRGCSLYQKQSNPVWDEAALAGRMRFSEPKLIAKTGGGRDLKQIVHAIHEGLPFYYLPDLDHGHKNSIFVPFFGVPAATVPMVGRLAHVTRAAVIFCVAEMTRDGYLVHLSEPWKDFPKGDPEVDTLRVTQELESWIRRLPDQYLWTHRRFKTRPEGQPSVY